MLCIGACQSCTNALMKSLLINWWAKLMGEITGERPAHWFYFPKESICTLATLCHVHLALPCPPALRIATYTYGPCRSPFMNSWVCVDFTIHSQKVFINRLKKYVHLFCKCWLRESRFTRSNEKIWHSLAGGIKVWEHATRGDGKHKHQVVPPGIGRGVSGDPTSFTETHQAVCNNLLLVWIWRYTHTPTWCLHESFYSWASKTYIHTYILLLQYLYIFFKKN